MFTTEVKTNRLVLSEAGSRVIAIVSKVTARALDIA